MNDRQLMVMAFIGMVIIGLQIWQLRSMLRIRARLRNQRSD